jgi:hypothetical protein
MSRPESVSSRTASTGFKHRHLQHFVALLFSAREADIDGPLDHLVTHGKLLALFLDPAKEGDGINLGFAAQLCLRIHGGPQEIDRGHARDLNRILHGQEDAGGRALFRVLFQQVLAAKADAPGRDLIARLAREDVGQGRLARPVGAHDGVNFAGADRQGQAFQDLPITGAGMKVPDLKHRYSPDKAQRPGCGA